ncbi:B12-binding domain-containing radical SAM protein [Candidatus Omnitrophota bacterium]
MSQIPLGLGYIAAVLKQAGHLVEIIDIDLERTNEKIIKSRLIEGKIDLVGITTTTPTYNNALSLAKTIKNACNAYVVLGGVHVTILPEESIDHPQIDFVVAGEGEITILELIRSLEERGDLCLIDGLVFKRNGKIIKNRPRLPLGNLDSLPFPTRDLFRDNKYTYPDSLYRKTAPMMTSRGCFGKCTFCQAPALFSGNCRFRSAKNVVDEIEYLVKKQKIKEIHFWDDNFLGNRKRVFQIRDILKERGIKIKCALPNGVRVDLITEEILACLKDMGVYSIAIGVESGSQEVLDLAKKNVSLQRIEESMRLIKNFGLESWAFLIFGLPGEDRHRSMETIDFTIKIDPDVAKFHILKPYPGAAVFNYLKERNLILNYSYKDYGIHSRPVHRLEALTDKEISEFQKLAYRRFYLRPKKFLKHIIRLRSFYRLKLNILMAVLLLKKTFERRV